MDNEILVNDLRGTISALRKSRGHVALFMLSATEVNASAASNLIVSASGYDDMPTEGALTDLVNLLKSTLGRNSLKQISRVTVLKTQDPFVRGINQAFRVEKDSTASLQSVNVFGIRIDNAVILESVRFEGKKKSPTKKSMGKKTLSTKKSAKSTRKK